MPILHVQPNPLVKGSQGQLVQVPPRIILQRHGPCIQVTIGLAQSMAKVLLQQGKTLPQPISGLALIDTGASATCIDDAAAQQMRLPVVNIVQIASASPASAA